MMTALADSHHEHAANVAVNVRTFVDVEHADVKVLWVDMKDEDPQYSPDGIRTQPREQSIMS